MTRKVKQARARDKKPALTLSLMALLLLSSCSTYSGKFACGDSKGANCVMLSEVDKRIDSGEIEEVYKEKKCSGDKCKSRSKEEAEPSLKSFENLRALIIEDKEESDQIEGQYIILK
jgi:hypothetical protein